MSFIPSHFQRGSTEQVEVETEMLSSSPCTVTAAETTEVPYSLLATHSYTPPSLGATGEIFRPPLGVVVNLPVERGAESALLQVTVAVGKL